MILGTSVLFVGVAMIVLPGPAILATQFAWARFLLRKMKRKARELSDEVVESIGKRNGGT